MDYKVMEQLLDKYFDGETSLQEESRLREYFRRADVPEALQPYQPLFRHLHQNAPTSWAPASTRSCSVNCKGPNPRLKCAGCPPAPGYCALPPPW